MIGKSAESAFKSAKELLEKHRMIVDTDDILNWGNILAYLEIRMDIERTIPYTKPDR